MKNILVLILFSFIMMSACDKSKEDSPEQEAKNNEPVDTAKIKKLYPKKTTAADSNYQAPEKYVKAVEEFTHDEILGLLPEKIDGYNALVADKGVIVDNGKRYKQVFQSFTSKAGFITIAVIDYETADQIPPAFFEICDNPPNDANFKASTVKTKNFKGYKEYSLRDRKGTLKVQAAKRFMIDIAYNKLPDNIGDAENLLKYFDIKKFKKIKK